jgi:NADH-quinone oxidoreductase subunit L
MHAGIVNGGGFLINRLAPLYGASTTTLHLAFLIGMVTAIVGTAVMLTRTDIKTKLGFSTVGQMGFMIMECGLGAFALAIFHLVAHGIFKASLFLHAGSVVHDIRKEPNLPEHKTDVSEKSLQLSWTTGVLLTLVVPFLILLGTHALLGSQMYQGTVIFLFFAWVTSSEAIMSLYSMRVYGSWKAVVSMVFAVALVVVTYLWAAESFTEFLYPVPGVASSYFHSASFPLWIFDLFIAMIVVLFLSAWAVLRPGRHITKPLSKQSKDASVYLYLLLWNGLNMGINFSKISRFLSTAARRCDSLLPEWIP